ncbi:MAG: hypothetical protein DMG02_33660 [Acidobacteria bacterium]|nr:MAG: hypothetical protein DMG02_33660 [Acidobacteriota bacterium]
MVSALLALLLAAAPPDRPTLTVAGDRVLVALPPSILKQKEVRARLESALTTTFIVKTKDSNARIEIRYDLWDEVYRVKRVDAAGRVAQQQIANAAQLEAWWRTPVEIARLAGDRAALDLELVVLPFSAADESDARQWLSKSGGTRDPSIDSKSVVDALIGTTLSARPIVSYRWSLEARR